MFRGVVAGVGAVNQPEQLPRDKLEVPQAGVGFSQVQHAGALAVLFAVPQRQ